ncbi:hypothetical protein ABPG72_009646 [Tetrahymena utriculariae]
MRHQIKQQISFDQRLNTLDDIEVYIRNEQRLTNDLSEHEYDSNTLRIMLIKYRQQQEQEKLQLQKKQVQLEMPDEIKFRNELMKDQLKYSFQQFQNQIKSTYSPEVADMTLSNMLTIKLQAHKFMEIAYIHFDQDENQYSFYAQCAINMAYKLNIYCTVECLDDYHDQDEQKIQIWQHKALEFENKINEFLGWNCQVTTVSQFFYYFIDNHFYEKYNSIIKDNSELIEQINDKIIDTYLQYKWRPISIALGYLSYLFQDDEEDQAYLCFIIQHYKTEFSQLDATIDEEEISQVRDHLENQVTEQDDQVYQKIEICFSQKGCQQQQCEDENIYSENYMYGKRLSSSSSSSQIQNYEQEDCASTNNNESFETQQVTNNRKRSCTEQYTLCKKNLYNESNQEFESKIRCQSHQYYNLQDMQEGKLRKKFKSSNVY